MFRSLDDELPLFFKPGDGHAPHRVAIIDGGLKAYVFAESTGMNVIGSAGGDWYQSPTKHYIETQTITSMRTQVSSLTPFQ